MAAIDAPAIVTPASRTRCTTTRMADESSRQR